MTTKNENESVSDYLKQLEKAQNDRIEEMFEELKECNIGFLSEISSKRS